MSEEQSSYLHHLPAIYQDNAFLGQFLLAFERILTRGTPDAPALAEVIASVDRYFRPLAPGSAPSQQTPTEFLPWLAGWVSFTLREDWDEATRRRFLSEMAPLYRQRGTKAGLRRMLQIYLGEGVPVNIYDTAVELHPILGQEPPPYFFLVEVQERSGSAKAVRQKERVALAIIAQEKPAHTTFALRLTMPTMCLLSPERAAELDAEPLVLGKNTLLGSSLQRFGKLFESIPPLSLPFTLDETTRLGTT